MDSGSNNQMQIYAIMQIAYSTFKGHLKKKNYMV